MELDKAIQERRSIRKYKPDPISDDVIAQLLEAARLAASGSNTQPWRFVSVRSSELKEKIKETTRYKFVAKAPVLLVCCADLSALDKRPVRLRELIDAGVFDGVEVSGDYAPPPQSSEQMKGYLNLNVGIAITHIMLKAVDLGLGTCWIGGCDKDKVKEILNLEDHLMVVALLPVGYADETPKPRPRLALEEIWINAPVTE